MRGYIASFIGVALALASAAEASPWGRAPLTSFSSLRAEAYKTDTGGGTFEQQSYQTYTEIGVGAGLTLGGKYSYGIQNVPGPVFDDTREGTLEAEIYLQRQLRSGENPLALKATYAAETELRSLATGTAAGERDAALEISALKGWGRARGFTTLEAGYRASLGGDADRAIARAAIGQRVKGDTLLMLELDGAMAVSDPGGRRGLDYDLFSVSPSVVIPVGKNISLQLGARADLASRNTSEGEALFISIWFGE